MDDGRWIPLFSAFTFLAAIAFWLFLSIAERRKTKTAQRVTTAKANAPQFTTELEALIAIEENTRQALELLRQQNRKSFWSMLFLFGMFSDD